LQRLAAEGLTFEWAIAPSAWTLPSHAAMFTGRPASALSASWRSPLDGAHPTVAEILTRHGYATGAFVANPFYTHHESGVDRGFQVLHDFRRSRAQVLWSTTFTQTPLVIDILWGDRAPSAILRALGRFDLRPRSEPQSDRRRAAEVIDEFLGWQGEQRVPFFAFLNLFDAHDPYVAPPGYETFFAAKPTKQDIYDAGIRYMDDQVNRLARTLAERGVLDNTVIIVTSDHGEQWGEHGLVNHGNSLYIPVVHVPLLVRLPGATRAGEKVPAPVSLTDFAATVLAVTGVTDPRVPGGSLLSPNVSAVVTETEALDASTRDKAPAARGALASIVSDSLQYIRNGDGTYQLFNIRQDYAQETDLVTSPAGCAVAVRLDALLRATTALPRTPPFTEERCPRAVTSTGEAKR
ncbi:MAG: sulfatase, partial [Cytophagaceae bacterium]|nr:sulfatase [Gemmatimonadaceae bacterium]